MSNEKTYTIKEFEVAMYLTRKQLHNTEVSKEYFYSLVLENLECNYSYIKKLMKGD